MKMMVNIGIAFNLILIRAKQNSNTQRLDQQPSHPEFTTIGPEITSSTLGFSVTRVESKSE